jgi:hypothetical protein
MLSVIVFLSRDMRRFSDALRDCPRAARRRTGERAAHGEGGHRDEPRIDAGKIRRALGVADR